MKQIFNNIIFFFRRVRLLFSRFFKIFYNLSWSGRFQLIFSLVFSIFKQFCMDVRGIFYGRLAFIIWLVAYFLCVLFDCRVRLFRRFPWLRRFYICLARFFLRYIATTNRKRSVTIYIIFSLFAGSIGAVLSLLIRINLAVPGNLLFNNSIDVFYYTVVMAHALIMIFFMVRPALMGGFGNWLVPILIGAREMTFPRINNFCFFIYVFVVGDVVNCKEVFIIRLC